VGFEKFDVRGTFRSEDIIQSNHSLS